MKNLKSLRKNANLTLAQLSKELKTSSQVLSRYEREEREADYKTLAKIAKYFDVSIDYLLGESNYFYPDQIKTVEKNNPAEKELLKVFRTLPEPEQAQITEYAKFIAEKHNSLTESKKNA